MRMLRLRPSPLLALLALAAALAAGSPAHATPPLRTWSLAGSGFWNTSGNWTPLGTPVGGDSVLVPASLGSNTVTLDVDTPGLNNFVLQGAASTFDLNGHTLTSGALSSVSGTVLASGAVQAFYAPLHSLSGAQFLLANGAALGVNSAWQNDGHGVIHSTAGGSVSALNINGYVTLSGTGDLQLADPANALIASPSGYVLTHAAGHQIHGAGRITTAIVNHGTITADYAPGSTLSIENASASNDGTLRATNGAKLMLDNTLTNAGGLIIADGGNVELNGANVSNGSLHTTGTSVIETSANSLIGGTLNLGGALVVNSGHVLSNTGGTLADSGSILVHASGAAASAFRLSGYLTLSGPGNLLLNDPALAAIDSPSSYTLTHAAGHTIHGTGSITVPLTNHGLVNADVSGQALTITSTVGNDGTLEATGGGVLSLQGNTITNSGGGAVLATGGDVRLTNATINGGPVQSTGANVISAYSGSSTLNTPTLAGLVRIESGSVLVTNGTVNNSGVVQVRPPSGSSTATLRLNGYATYQGAGSIQMTNSTQSVLDSPSSYTITQNAGHTLHGAGQVTLPFTNHGLVSADLSGQTLTLSNSLINDATLQATGSGVLALTGSTINNTGGSIKANGGNVQLTGETVNAGTLSRTGSNAIVVASSSTFNGVTNSALVQVNGGSVLNISGTFPNTGNYLIRQPAGTGAATLRLLGYATLSGTGAAQLTDPAQSIVDSPSGYTLTNAATHTIHGTGSMTLPVTNQGLISADVSAQQLTMTSTITNSGTLQSVGGGILQLSSATLNNTGGTVAATSGDVRMAGTTLGGGQLTSGQSNGIVFNGNSSWTGSFTNNAVVRINGGVTIDLAGIAVADSGYVIVRAPADTATAALQLNGYMHFGGNGSILLTHGSQSVIDSPSGYYLYNDGQHIIRGTGMITCPFYNSAMTVADVPDSVLQVTHSTLNLTGTQAATNGGTLRFSSNTPNYAANTLTGGTWQAGPASTIQLPSVDIRHVAANLVLDGPGSDIVTADSSVSALRRLSNVNLNGAFIVRNGRAFTVPVNLASSGIVGVGPGASLTVPASVGGAYYQMDTSATFLVEIAAHGAPGTGKIIVNGAAQAAGHLRIRLLNGFVPFETDTFEVMDFTSRTGDFAHLDSVQVAQHLELLPVWQANRLLLVPHHTATTDVPPTPGATTAPQALAFSARSGAGSAARLELALPHPATLDVSLFDVTGRRVANVAQGEFGAGRWNWTWGDGRDAAASGVYFARARVTMDGATHDLTSRFVLWH